MPSRSSTGFNHSPRVMDAGNPSSHASRDEVIADSEEELEYPKSLPGVFLLFYLYSAH